MKSTTLLLALLLLASPCLAQFPPIVAYPTEGASVVLDGYSRAAPGRAVVGRLSIGGADQISYIKFVIPHTPSDAIPVSMKLLLVTEDFGTNPAMIPVVTAILSQGWELNTLFATTAPASETSAMTYLLYDDASYQHVWDVTTLVESHQDLEVIFRLDPPASALPGYQWQFSGVNTGKDRPALLVEYVAAPVSYGHDDEQSWGSVKALYGD